MTDFHLESQPDIAPRIPSAASLREHALILKHLPPGRTFNEAVRVAKWQRDSLYAEFPNDEDARLARLSQICIRMCGGNVKAGEALAGLAVWGG